MSKVIGFRELIDERFQSGDLFVAQFLLNIRTITAGNADNIFCALTGCYQIEIFLRPSP